MGISAVAVYSEADKNALHVSLADESYCIGGPQVGAVSYTHLDVYKRQVYRQFKDINSFLEELNQLMKNKN